MGGEEPSRPARRFARNAGQLVRLHTEAIREAPLVALLPLVLFSFCVTGGVVAVRFAALSYANSEKEVATALLASVTTGFASLLETTLYPMLVVQKHIESGDAAAVHASAQTFWTKTAPSLIALSPAIDDIQLAPYGVAVTIYPLVTARRNATSILALGGHDLLNASSPIANRRAAALLAITTRGIMIEGPKSLLLPGASACTGSGCATIDPLLGILARQAMFVQTPNANDAWSGGTTWPGVLPGQVLGPITGPTNCSGVLNPATGLSVCALNATGDGTKFWGFTTVIVIWSQLLDLAKVTALGGSNGQPYQWSVSRSSEASLGVAPFAWVYTSSNTGALPAAPGGAKDALFASATVFSSQWGFTLQKPGGWRPVWERGVIAGVVLMSALIALSLYLLALERRRHLQLLFSMLPARMVRRMRGASGGFAESFPHAVILFSDIVSYTDLVSVLTPDQVMVMLNELFGEFDALVDKHGVVKVETIGDAYVVVAGAPSPVEPEAQARAMASMALDMIDVASRHTAPDGTPMRIRVGISCGPIMAGVVGRKQPRWCLFGDAVNVASRMETTSVPMRCQVSNPVAELLAPAAKEPGVRFNLESRGRVSVKGKGDMTTWFLVPSSEAGDSVRQRDPLARGSASDGGALAPLAPDLESDPTTSAGGAMRRESLMEEV